MAQIEHNPILWESESSDTALLMVHGIFGSPNQFTDMAEYFHERGYTVQTVLLPGHGGSTQDFANTRAFAWRAYYKLCLKKLKSRYKRVVLVGHSMGGLLAAECVTEMECDGLILIGTPTSIAARLTSLHRHVTNAKALDENMEDYMSMYSVDTPKLWEALSWTMPMLDLVQMCSDVHDFLPEINVPVFICQSKGDTTIGRSSAEDLALGLNHTLVEITLLKDSTHSHFTPEERALLLRKMERFLERL